MDSTCYGNYLFAGLILHIIQGLLLWQQNSAARPVKYAVSDANKNSKWYSRSMGILGTLLLICFSNAPFAFLAHTKQDIYFGEDNENSYEKSKKRYSVFGTAVALYVAGVISLSWHLYHGFGSAFQTFGINHKRYTPIIKRHWNCLFNNSLCIICIDAILMF